MEVTQMEQMDLIKRVKLDDNSIIEYYKNRQIRKTSGWTNNCSIFTNNNRSGHF
jgi:hypothetical protein